MSDLERENWGRLRDLFEAATQREPSQRQAYLDQACGDDQALRTELEELLAVHDRADDVLEPASDSRHEALRMLADLPAEVPDHIGPYRITGVIASGGMGTVYQAEQEHPRRAVALKVMRWSLASPSAQRRFHYESQLLARLRHPGIAQVYEAGTHADGAHRVPYFAMEYVPCAKPITEHVEQAMLDLRQRLELFARVCDAVDHGHQRGIVHRDLKPSNILVDAEGLPRVIDFGIAKSVDSDIAVTTMQTGAGQLVGTLQYMSPEQCRADPHDIDTRSDVYSLGMVLYELLSGKLPYDLTNLALHEATRVVCDQPPTKLSTVDARLRGEVETIVRRALAKDRDERYGSASALADDIRRYLAGEAILAHPPSTLYQLRKFTRRHRALVAAVAAVFVVLVLGVVVSTAMYFRAEIARVEADGQRDEAGRQRDEADLARTEAVRITAFLTDTLGQADLRRGRGPDVKLRAVLDEAARRLEDDETLGDQPRVRAALHAAIGNAYVSHNAYEPKAEKHLLAALEIRRRHFGPEHPKVAEGLNDLAIAIWFKPEPGGQSLGALLRQALAIRDSRLGPKHRQTLMTKALLADLLRDAGKSEAERLYREILRDRRETLGPKHKDVAQTLSSLGRHLHWQNRLDEGETLLREALAIQTELLGADSLSVGQTSLALGSLLDEKGQWAEAELLLRRSLDILRAKYNPDHVIIGHATSHLGRLLLKTERFKEAEPLLREALDNRIAQPAQVGMWYLPHRRLLYGQCLAGLGRHGDAERELRKAHELLEALRDKTKDQPRKEAIRADFAQTAVRSLVDLYEASSKPDQAAVWRKKLPPQTQPAS